MNTKVVPAGAFKQGCLAIIESVAAGDYEVIITKRGKPVARLVPVVSDREREETILAGLRGKAKMLVPEDEFLRPTLSDGGWNLHGDEER
jgi:prevent-host-death family protein